jgi:hypothetical protein|uniref:HEAT repeat domain-containing protein n=1 Tax=Desulfobacca acetoxidans TaxID=60893 RepID=A0A7C3WKT2_9BACT
MIEEVPHRLISCLESWRSEEETVACLVESGPAVIEPLSRFLLEGKPNKVFQPRLWAVKALAALGCREVLLAYLFQERDIVDPEERLGEEAVESAAARCLAAWRDEETLLLLLRLSEHRLLNGLIEALAEFRALEAIPYFERALEDDFYRPAAESAFLKLGSKAAEALAQSAVTPRPEASTETPGSLKRRRSAVRLLNAIGVSKAHWQILRDVLYESDAELMVENAKLGLRFASEAERLLIAHRLIQCLPSASWMVQSDMEEILTTLWPEAAYEMEREIARRLKQPETARAWDPCLSVLLRVKRRAEQASYTLPESR